MVLRSRWALAVVPTLVVVLATAEPPLQAQTAPARHGQEAGRETWQRVPEIFAAMGIGPGAVVADVGAGDGFLTVRLARAVGAGGQVFAVDVSDRALEQLRARVHDEALTNVTVIKGDPDDPNLGAASLDAAVIINSYHEMVAYPVMLERLRAALKPGGRLVISEFLSEKRIHAGRKQQVGAHEIAAAFVEQEARDAGFRIHTLHDPFVTRSDVREWLIVAVPEAGVEPTNAPPSAPATSDSAQTDPDLRIAFDDFKKRR